MNTSKGTRGGGSALAGLKTGEGWPPDVHVHVRSIPAYLVWVNVCGLVAALFLLAFIAFQARECVRWTHSSAHALSIKLNVPLDEEK